MWAGRIGTPVIPVMVVGCQALPSLRNSLRSSVRWHVPYFGPRQAERVQRVHPSGGTVTSGAGPDGLGWRPRELNKRLTAHASSFLNRLSNLMCPLLEGRESDANSFSCQQTPSKLTIHLKSELSGLPFYWDFHCPAAAVEVISRHLVRPLIRMSLALQYQLQELASLLVQKDAEIEDYRDSGAALSRGRLRTEPFQEKPFLQKFVDEVFKMLLCVSAKGTWDRQLVVGTQENPAMLLQTDV
ncbi:Non-like proteinous end-joining factor 1 [Chelonia mydas]|uniref:Non-homologous end-joining factor 1 n=1 Tax=Chelonia mydas TaxID=8469 RepID=M7C401_CHEMY|nr:Non-like proteinous end-joining factor 1 [Chelonia mydas]